ncbi:MAG: hypothetical protein C4299_04875, partial [Thermoleophilia bacterium]
NALRRVLLSSIPGAAVTSVRIEGVLSEFEPIPGVKEDTIHFLLNLKNLAIRINSAQPRDQYLLRLNRQGPGVVYAGLVLNEKGYERLASTGLDEAHFAFAASESFNRRNQNASVDESLQTAARIIARAHEDGIRATATVGTAFGCPF